MFMTVVLASIIVVLFEYRGLWKHHKYREFAFSASFLAISIIISVLTYYKVNIPSPLNAINMIFKPISQYVTRLLA